MEETQDVEIAQPTPEPKPEASVIPPEEGVKGWLCIVGASFAMFASFGFLNAYAEYSLMYCSITQYADTQVSASASSNPHTKQPHSVRTLRLTSRGSSLFNLP